MVRRTFNDAGKIADNLAPYAEAMNEVAQEKSAAVIDLHASSAAFFEKLGPKDSVKLANRKTNNTHFNEKGARAMADLVMQELPTVEPKPKSLLKDQ